MVDAVAKPMTLADVLSINKAKNITILNEINEVLLEASEIDYYVWPLSKALNEELLNRAVLSTSISDTDFVIQVAGMEDAE